MENAIIQVLVRAMHISEEAYANRFPLEVILGHELICVPIFVPLGRTFNSCKGVFNMFLNSNIKHLRYKQNLTQSQLSIILDVGVRTIQKYETGEITNLKLQTLLKLSKLLKCTLDDLVNVDMSK